MQVQDVTVKWVSLNAVSILSCRHANPVRATRPAREVHLGRVGIESDGVRLCLQGLYLNSCGLKAATPPPKTSRCCWWRAAAQKTGIDLCLYSKIRCLAGLANQLTVQNSSQMVGVFAFATLQRLGIPRPGKRPAMPRSSLPTNTSSSRGLSLAGGATRQLPDFEDVFLTYRYGLLRQVV